MSEINDICLPCESSAVSGPIASAGSDIPAAFSAETL